MKILIFTFCLLSLFALTKSDPGCANTLFNQCETFFCNVVFLTTPATKPNVAVCNDIAAGASTCCDQNAYNAISTAFATGQTEIQLTVTELQNAQTEIQTYIGAYQDFIDNLGQYASEAGLTQDQTEALQNGYQAILDATTQFIDSVIDDWVPCAEGLLTYWAGIFCFGCDPNWGNYVTVNNGDITVNLDTTTCTQLDSACSNFFTDVVNFVLALESANTQIQQAYPSQFGVGVVPSGGISETNLCGSEGCANYICYEFIAGFTYDSSALGSLGGVAKRGDKMMKEMVKIGEWMNSKREKSGDMMVKGVRKMLGGVQELKLLNKKLRGGGSVNNTYTSGGYPAYNNGQSSGLDTTVQGSGSVLSNWLSLSLWA